MAKTVEDHTIRVQQNFRDFLCCVRGETTLLSTVAPCWSYLSSYDATFTTTQPRGTQTDRVVIYKAEIIRIVSLIHFNLEHLPLRIT